jgi:hypothetical protein
MSIKQSEDDHTTLMDGLARGLTVYKACLQINEMIFGEDSSYDVIPDNKDDIIQEVVDNYVSELWDFELVSIIYNFGFDKALKSYKDNFGEVHTSKAIVHHLIVEQLPETDGYVNDDDDFNLRNDETDDE